MGAEVVWSEIAVDDFEMLYHEIVVAKGCQAAENFRGQVLKLTELLGSFPRLGMVDPWNKQQRRMRIDSNNFVAYSVVEGKVLIEGIILYRRYRRRFPEND